MLLGFGALVSFTALAVGGRDPFHTWYFLFASVSYLFMVDGWVYRHRGESLLLSYPRRFLFLCLWSIPFWLLHELLNTRLGQWHYVGFPDATPARWAAHLLAFATVVPVVLETADLVDSAGFLKSNAAPSLHTISQKTLQIIGAALWALSLAWPSIFFPLVWAAPLFVFDPINERNGEESLLTDWRTGRDRRLITLALAGLFCGFLWQGANLLSGAHWEWTLPGFFEGKIFNLPVLGYLVFPPFAAGVFSTSVWAVALWERSRPGRRLGLALCAVCFSGAVLWHLGHTTGLHP